MALTNLSKMTAEEIVEAFSNNGITEMEFTEVKFKNSKFTEGQLQKTEFVYTGLWYDDEEGSDAITTIYVWVDSDNGCILADSCGDSKYMKDFL